MKMILTLATALLATGFELAAAESPPDWYLEEIQILTSGTGRWEADNVAYKSDEEQFGWGGVIGIGTMWREEAATVSDQEFSAPDGRQWRAGHRSYFPDGATHVTASFDIVDGQWMERRSYTWKKVGPPKNDG